jgi:hypothetical protein
MNSQVNMCVSNSHLSKEQQLIVIIIFMVVFGGLYFYNVENIMNYPVFLEVKEKEEEEEENWDIYFKKDKHKKKDVNKWYILPGNKLHAFFNYFVLRKCLNAKCYKYQILRWLSLFAPLILGLVGQY